ncbi:MAG: hypothetical protein GXP59_02170 [Deltaproteobacteria bacterium]|nr:hypothetical protein [Deltaproteobacteria bacterium]
MRNIVILLTGLLLGACALHKPAPDNQAVPVVNRIIVMPVTLADNPTAKSTPQSLATGKVVLSGLIHDYFKGDRRVNILSEAQVSSYRQGYEDHGQRLKRISKRLNADTVMAWQISRYVEKDGGDYSANHPSSVAFSYRLTNIATGQTLCSSKVDKTQETLTGNLFSARQFLRHGGKWISARQLTWEVMNKKLHECRYLSMPAAK